MNSRGDVVFATRVKQQLVRVLVACAAAFAGCGSPTAFFADAASDDVTTNTDAKARDEDGDASGPDASDPDAMLSDAAAVPDARVADASTHDAATTKALTSLVFRAADNPNLGDDVAASIQGTVATASVPMGANQSLVATFATTGTRVEVSGVVQQSGVTANRFLGPVVYRVFAADGTSDDYMVVLSAPSAQQAYVKASNTRTFAFFGSSVAMSSDGNTLAVGSYGESSAATGVNGNQSDTSASASGAVYVFVRNGTAWGQQAYLKASNTRSVAYFGASLALSSDGSTLAVGSYSESSAATGINGNQADTSAASAGAAYVFSRVGITWSQQAYVKASNTRAMASFGTSVALAGDGNTLAVGSPGESSGATGIDGNQGDTAAGGAGAVYVFARSGSAWSQQSYVKASNTRGGAGFGTSTALSSDGATLAVGARGEASAATGINGTQANAAAASSGAVYVFARAATTWTQQAYVKASNTRAGAQFGACVALASNGNTLAVGSQVESSAAIGINGNQADTSAGTAGAVYVFARSGSVWAQQAYVKASNTRAGARFGASIALARDGNTMVIGSYDESSAAAGIGGNQADSSAPGAGAAYVFARGGSEWSQQAYVKASNTRSNAELGSSVALSADGSSLAVGSYFESSAATGVNGNESNGMTPSGAVYIFR